MEKLFINILSVVTAWVPLAVGTGHAGAGITVFFIKLFKLTVPGVDFISYLAESTTGSTFLKKQNKTKTIKEFNAA